MKTKALMFVLVTAFAMAFVGCGGGGASTPEDAVKGMMEAAQAKDWEKAVSYMDIEGMAKAMKEMMDEQMKDMDDETKKQMEEQVGDMTDPKKLKEKFIKEMKEDEGKQDFTYKIIETKDKKDDSAKVVVEITEKGEEPDKETFDVKKIGGKWMITFEGAMAGE